MFFSFRFSFQKKKKNLCLFALVLPRKTPLDDVPVLLPGHQEHVPPPTLVVFDVHAVGKGVRLERRAGIGPVELSLLALDGPSGRQPAKPGRVKLHPSRVGPDLHGPSRVRARGQHGGAPDIVPWTLFEAVDRVAVVEAPPVAGKRAPPGLGVAPSAVVSRSRSSPSSSSSDLLGPAEVEVGASVDALEPPVGDSRGLVLREVPGGVDLQRVLEDGARGSRRRRNDDIVEVEVGVLRHRDRRRLVRDGRELDPQGLALGAQRVSDFGGDVAREALVAVGGEEGEGHGRFFPISSVFFFPSFFDDAPLPLVPTDNAAVEAVPPVVVGGQREDALFSARRGEGEGGAGDAVGDAADDDAKVGERAVLPTDFFFFRRWCCCLD